MYQPLRIETPRWAKPALKPHQYLGIYGGRAGGKSHFLAELMIEGQIQHPNRACVCIREIQKSLTFSVKRLLEQKIQNMNAGYYFDVQANVIKSAFGDGIIVFQGMQNHTADSIKSLEDFEVAWVEEAQKLSARSLDLLRPTIRGPGSSKWFSWNPYLPTDPVDHLFRGDLSPPDACLIDVNYDKNPWFSEEARLEMEFDRQRDTENYLHIWRGHYLKNSKARVFNNWRIDEFDTPADAVFRLGADWGFSVDPTVLVRCFIVGRTLYIDYEVYKINCEIDAIAQLCACLACFGKRDVAGDFEDLGQLWPIQIVIERR